MKTIRNFLFFAVLGTYILGASSCTRYGCPSNGKNVGAERILAGEKVPKARKFRS
ncbi:hypothetical protein GGD38_005221 [Chitinophagaceae bacterium OAS944]|nr:hypothetical protein [Chitinophagaceae bacterium OAS944]